jgi:hypothetical protein
MSLTRKAYTQTAIRWPEFKSGRNLETTKMQRFLGLIQYLAHFLPDISVYNSPLAAMTKNGWPFYWHPLHDTCFQMIKNICCMYYSSAKAN